MQVKILLIVFSFLLFLFAFISPKSALAATYNLSGNVQDNSNNAIVGATVEVLNPGTTNVVVATTTDSSGNYSLTVDEGTYNAQVTPPSGSGFGPVIALNQNITVDKVLNFVLIPAGTIVFSGQPKQRSKEQEQ